MLIFPALLWLLANVLFVFLRTSVPSDISGVSPWSQIQGGIAPCVPQRGALDRIGFCFDVFGSLGIILQFGIFQGRDFLTDVNLFCFSVCLACLVLVSCCAELQPGFRLLVSLLVPQQLGHRIPTELITFCTYRLR